MKFCPFRLLVDIALSYLTAKTDQICHIFTLLYTTVPQLKVEFEGVLFTKAVRRFFFFKFFVSGSSYPNFCILEKNKILFLTFFISSDVKNCQIKKKYIFKKK